MKILRPFYTFVNRFVTSSTLLAGIIVLAFLLRVPNIYWGVPSTSPPARAYHPDEPKIIQGALDFPKDVLTNTDLRYPTFLHYALGILSTPLKIFYPTNSLALYRSINLLGRWIVLLLSLTTIILVYLLGRDLGDKRQGLLASLLLSFSLYHAQSSVWATTDVPLAFFTTLFVFLSWRAFRSQDTTKTYLLAGMLFGIVVGTKYTGFLSIAAFGILYWYYKISPVSGSFLKKATLIVKDKNLWAFGTAAMLTFFLSTPGLLLHPRAFLRSVAFEKARLSQAYLPIFYPLTWLHLFQKLSIAVGLPAALNFSLSLIFPLRGRKPIEWALVATIALTLITFGDSLLPRYYIFLLPLWSVLVARMWYLVSQIPRWRTLTFLWITGTLLFSLSYTFAGTLSRQVEPRTEAALYINKTIPAGTTIGIGYTSQVFGWKIHPWRYPPLNLDQFKETDMLDAPQTLIFSSFDVYPILKALQSPQMGTDYHLPQSEKGKWYRSAPPSPEVFRFYHDIFLSQNSEYCLIKYFPAKVYAPIEFPPPDIWIFARTDSLPPKTSCLSNIPLNFP